MKEETLVELLERRFVTADGVIRWDEQVKGLIDSAINRAKNLRQPDVSGNEANPSENKKDGEVALPSDKRFEEDNNTGDKLDEEKLKQFIPKRWQ